MMLQNLTVQEILTVQPSVSLQRDLAVQGLK